MFVSDLFYSFFSHQNLCDFYVFILKCQMEPYNPEVTTLTVVTNRLL